jgi:hypothetical protein
MAEPILTIAARKTALLEVEIALSTREQDQRFLGGLSHTILTRPTGKHYSGWRSSIRSGA